MLILIDTATTAGSVCFSEGDRVYAVYGHTQAEDHAAKIMGYVQRGLQELHILPSQIQAIAVTAGPGSYTGLRVGLSTAKGLCYAWNCPLVLLPTLRVMAAGYLLQHPSLASNSFLLPVLLSRRSEVYAALYKADGTELISAHPLVLDAFNLAEWQAYKPLVVFGEGAERLYPHLQPMGMVEIDYAYQLSAADMRKLAWEAVAEHRFADLAYAEPFYLKPTYAG